MRSVDRIDPYVRVYDGVVDPEYCRQIVDLFERDKVGQAPGQTSGGVNPEVNNLISLQIDLRKGEPEIGAQWSAVDGKLREVLNKSWRYYISDVPSGRHISQRPISDTGFHVQKYLAGEGHFRPHVDASSPNTAFRVAAAIIYLNTIDAGGGTRFTHLDATVSCVAGRVLWFPATWTYEHEGTVPVSAHKWSISTFYAHPGQQLLPHLTPALNALSRAVRRPNA